MVTGSILFLSLFNNLALFIILVFVYPYVSQKIIYINKHLNHCIKGLIFGLFIFGCMHVKIPVADGVLVDQRNAFVILSGVFGGPLSAFISSIVGSIYRIYLGGQGIYGGILGLFLSAISGSIIYRIRKKNDSIFRIFIYSIASAIFVLPGFIPIKSLEYGLILMKEMTIPYGLAITTGIFTGMLLISNQERSHDVKKELIKSEKRYRKLFESLIDVVFRTDLSGKISLISPSCKKLFGYDAEEVIGTKITQYYKYPEKRNKILEMIQNNGFVDNLEEEMVKKDGSIITVSVNAKMIRDDDFFGIEGIVRDITFLKNSEKENRKLEEDLRQSQKLESIGQLAGGIAHDFNNMLGGIIGGAELLSPKIKPGTEEMEYLQMIIESADRASSLAGKLLSFSRRESVVLHPVDIHQIVKETLAILKNTIDKRIVIETSFEADESIVLGEAVQLQNVFLNLGINSWQAMPEGGKLSILTSIQNIDSSSDSEAFHGLVPGKYIRIEIEDTGFGISEKNIDHIFEPFFTTKEQGKGTGLGLPAVYGTIKRYGGLITVKSEQGKGTVFSIILPLTSEKIPEVVKTKKTISKGKGLILIAEDEITIRNIEAKIITECGYDCLIAQNGKEALELYIQKSSEILLVILDMIMPEMSGKDCFFEIKKINPDARIILCSGYSREEDTELIKMHGLSGYIKKPFKKDDFCNTIYEIISSSI